MSEKMINNGNNKVVKGGVERDRPTTNNVRPSSPPPAPKPKK